MKIKFIVPRWPKDSFWDVITFKFPTLSNTLLAALTPPEHEVTIHDESIAPLDFDEACDLVAVTAMTPLAPRGYDIADEYRRRKVQVVMGGMHPTWLPEEAITHCDAVVIGEADEIWAKVVRDAERGKLKRFYQQKGRTDLSHLPLPRRELLPSKGYFFENTIQTTRGCPFDCEFCSVTAIYGGTYRTRPVKEVEREIQALRRAQAYIFFVDDNIVGDMRYARELFSMLSQYRLRWVSQGPISIAQNEKLVRLMAQAGCHGMFIGFESLSPENLALMGKKTNKVERYEAGIKRFHDHGIGIHASFVFGYDYDDPSVFEEFIAFANRNKVDGAFLPLLTPPRNQDPSAPERRGEDHHRGLEPIRHGHRGLQAQGDDRRRAAGGVLVGQQGILLRALHGEEDLSAVCHAPQSHYLRPLEHRAVARSAQGRAVFLPGGGQCLSTS